MKYAILIGDGMSDNPIGELGGKTPLQYAKTLNMDFIASNGVMGLFKSVPEGMPPGSDVANLTILGYDPKKYYTGRAPLEAASIGVKLAPGDIAFRCNLVTLRPDGKDFIMEDYSSGHITTEEASEIIKTLDKEFKSQEGFRFYPGKSYRHLMVWEGGSEKLKTTPPHDISDRVTGPYLPSGNGAEKLVRIMERSRDILKRHPVNKRREADGKRRADSIWLWGQGSAPTMPDFKDRFNLKGAIISAVDLMNGIGVYAGLDVIKVPGATGYIDTNYAGKADYALRALETRDLVCVHVEAPDEAGHQGLLKDKLRAIEDFDSIVVGKVLEGIKRYGEFRVMVLTDHPTPVELKTHTSDPVPFAVYGGERRAESKKLSFSEAGAKETGVLKEDPLKFMEEFLGR
ncbi:MAG: cofactor-independent phosphoglycerate mutase [Deltaproteobacteria bacterium]|nr:cofactor-independent phosphoglycerate mutase [Deltaproteobacteria bacterium]